MATAFTFFVDVDVDVEVFEVTGVVVIEAEILHPPVHHRVGFIEDQL